MSFSCQLKPTSDHTPEGAALTRLILAAFWLHGPLARAGDEIGRPRAVTSARWQVLNRIEDAPAPVAWIARDVGVRRQAIQVLVNNMVDEGLVERIPNPRHRRSMLVQLTGEGTDVLQALRVDQAEWANKLAREMSTRDLDRACAVLEQIRSLLIALDRTASTA